MTNYEIKKILDNYYQTYGADSIKKYWFKNYNDNMLSEEDWGLTTSSASGSNVYRASDNSTAYQKWSFEEV